MHSAQSNARAKISHINSNAMIPAERAGSNPALSFMSFTDHADSRHTRCQGCVLRDFWANCRPITASAASV
jgi:hypothetical protein